jgi:tRNA-dihydrouridine synthase 3
MPLLATHLTDTILLAPLTRGGNLPFRRLCVDFGAPITISEMAYSRFLVKGEGRELALLRRHPSEKLFGVQLAAKSIDEGSRAAQIAVERGADFIDINCGCPIHDTVRRGLGAHMLRRPKALGKFIAGLTSTATIPITVKIRIGWSDSDINVHEVSRILEESGAAAITIHGRSREQRYTKAANWALIGEVAAARNIPVIGNGDILTFYEGLARKKLSRCSALMVGRGALIKPWIFKELIEQRAYYPSAEERVGFYWQLAQYMKEHFRDDEKGRGRAMYFLPWHFSFFCRYRPWEQARWEAASELQPLIQTRPPEEIAISPLEKLLRNETPDIHTQLADLLWQSASKTEAISSLSAYADTVGVGATTETAQPNLALTSDFQG